MRFGHYTVFDTPEENKHTQVYVEYDVPNNDNLTGATGTIVLTEGGQGSGGGGESDANNGIESITISPEITTTPALDSLFPIYYEDLTAEQKEDGVFLSVNHQSMGEKNVSVTPTDNWYAAYTNEDEEFIIGGKGETIVIPISLSSDGSVDELQLQFSNGNTPETVTEYFSVNIEFHYA